MIRYTDVVGLDLGQLGDFSALVHLRHQQGQEGKPVYDVPTLHRWTLSTPYRQVGRDLARFLRERELQNATLVVDETGVGVAVVELVTEALTLAGLSSVKLIQATITSGNAVSKAGRGRWHVSKRQLVSALSAVVHGGRIRVAQGQPEAAALAAEMRAFRAKINLSTGNESYEAWRERDHDDLVLAVALAVWWAERKPVTAGAR